MWNRSESVPSTVPQSIRRKRFGKNLFDELAFTWMKSCPIRMLRTVRLNPGFCA